MLPLVFVLVSAPLFMLLVLDGIHRVAGETIPAGLNGPEAGLCGMDRDGSVSILVGGDSRAKMQIIPQILTEHTGKSCINISEIMPFGGDLTTLANTLRKHPEYLAQKPTLVLSVSSNQVNDFDLDKNPLTMTFNWGLPTHLRFAAHAPGKYFPFLFSRLLPSLKKELIHDWRGDRFACSDEVYYPPLLAASKGFRGSTDHEVAGTFPEEERVDKDRFMIEGGNWDSFKRSLDWISKSDAGRIVVFHAPYNPKWMKMFPGSELRKNETRFSDNLRDLLRGYPEITLLDFYRNPDPLLDSSHFENRSHLNMRGAKVFSGIIARAVGGGIGEKGPLTAGAPMGTHKGFNRNEVEEKVGATYRN